MALQGADKARMRGLFDHFSDAVALPSAATMPLGRASA